MTPRLWVVGVQVYKQKLKHVLSEHHNTTSGLKMDGTAASSLIQNQRAEAELGLRGEAHGLQGDFREKERHNQNCIKELKLVSLQVDAWQLFAGFFLLQSCPPSGSQQKHQVELMELANSCDRRIRGE